MLLRLLTTFFLIFGILLAMGFPWLIGARPHGRVALEHYTVRFGIYLTVALVCFVLAALCALLMIRQARKAYEAESRRNLDDLVESTLRTHRKRSSDE